MLSLYYMVWFVGSQCHVSALEPRTKGHESFSQVEGLLSGQWKGPDQRLRVCLYCFSGCRVTHLHSWQTVPACLNSRRTRCLCFLGQKGKRGPPPPPAWKLQRNQAQTTPETPDEYQHEPSTKQMSRLSLRDHAQSIRVPSRKRPTWPTQQAALPTWGQIMNVCHQAQDIAVLQGYPPTPEKVFIAILALLACQVNTFSATPGAYWAYFPNPPPFQVVTWTNSPMRIHTTWHHAVGGSDTSYFYDIYPINLSYTFWGLTDGLSIYGKWNPPTIFLGIQMVKPLWKTAWSFQEIQDIEV